MNIDKKIIECSHQIFKIKNGEIYTRSRTKAWFNNDEKGVCRFKSIGKYSTRKHFQTTGLNVWEKRCIKQLEGVEHTCMEQNLLNLSFCRSTS